MSTPKPMASLSSTLLARPGGAKPAMRPQGYTNTPQADDLGWNDMGQAATPIPSGDSVPPVLATRAKLSEAIAPPAPGTASSRPAARPKAVPRTAGRKAAFTLRLDDDRHLRLRLASAVAGRSSQQLVVAALDAFLKGQPKVEDLASQVPPDAKLSFGENRA